jgi:hypothetical protein
MEYSEQYSRFINDLDSLELEPENAREKIKEVCDQYIETLKTDSASLYKFFLLEHENIHLTKSVSGGFNPMLSGTRINEEGEEVEYIWPDYNAYDSSSYEYFFDRFQNSKNDFLRANYGLTAYIAGYLKHNDVKRELIQVLNNVAQKEFKAIDLSKREHASYYFISENLRNAFELAITSRTMTLAEDIVRFIRAQFDSLEPRENGYYTFFYLLCDLYAEHKKDIDRYLDVNDFIKKTESDSNLLSADDDLSGALILARKGLAITQKYDCIPKKPWQIRIAETLEKIGDNEISRNNFFGCTNYQEAGEFYNAAGEPLLEQAVLKKYEEAQGKIELELFTSEMSDSEVEDLDNWIDTLVDQNDPALILSLWTLRSNITSIASIRNSVENSPSSFIDHFTSHSINKFGDTVERYETDEQKKDFKFWEQFKFSFQFSGKIAFSATIRAIKKNVISVDHLIGFLRVSWFNEPVKRLYQGKEIVIVPNEIIIPPIVHFFQYFKEYALDNPDIRNQDFVTSIDSMTLKFETILRFACERSGINRTFLAKSSNGFFVPKFKLLGIIFRELEERGVFDEMDSCVFRFLFIKPEHANYRNEVAHGIFDLHEYEPQKGLLILGAILRLAMLKFPIQEN